MPIITFWSNNEKAIGQTVSAALVATVMAIEKNYKVLLISADNNNDVMENCFGAQESNKELVKTLIPKKQFNLDSGIKGLLKMSESNRITPELIHDYTKIIFKNRLEVLYSPMNLIDAKEEKDFMDKIKNIIVNASKYYDQIIVDLKKGKKYSEQLDILSMSDVIVLNTEQKIKTIENFMNTDEFKKMQNKIMWNICKYDSNSKYNLKNLIRTVLKRQAVYNINYNTLLFDAIQEGEMVELLIRFKTIKEDDDNIEFISNIKELIDAILAKYQATRLNM